MKKLIWICLFATKVFAQNCEDIKDGEVVRLDQEGKSLANARVQDQDGLGTCYSNTASMMLQSVLNGNPEVSYLQLAFNQADFKNGGHDKKEGRSQAYDSKGQLLIEGGFPCETIELARKSGGVCSRQDVAIEASLFNSQIKQYADPNFMQLKLIQKVSKFYDDLSKDFSNTKVLTRVKTSDVTPKASASNNEEPSFLQKKINSFLSLFGFGNEQKENNAPVIDLNEPKKEEVKIEEVKKEQVVEVEQPKANEAFEQFKKSLKKTIEDNRDNYASAECKKPNTKNAEKVLVNIFTRAYNKIQDPSVKKSLDYRLLNIKLGYYFKVNTNGFESLDIHLDEKIPALLQKNYIQKLEKGNALTSAKDIFAETLKGIAPDINPKVLKEAIDTLDSGDLQLLNDDYKHYTLKDYSDCMDNGRLKYLTNDDGLLKDFKGDACYGHIKNLQDLVAGLDAMKLADVERIYKFIDKAPELSYEQAMNSLLAPDCSPDKKIKIPDNLKCNVESTYMSEEDKRSPESENKFMQNMSRKFSKLAESSFKNNKAFAVDICTSFWDKGNETTWYSRDQKCDLSKKHGFHAVSVIGYKCNQGKLKYLIQNSWGAWDQIKDVFEKDSFGKAWIDAEPLIKNTYQIEAMEEIK